MCVPVIQKYVSRLLSRRHLSLATETISNPRFDLQALPTLLP
jgi:hypothetical protein